MSSLISDYTSLYFSHTIDSNTIQKKTCKARARPDFSINLIIIVTRKCHNKIYFKHNLLLILHILIGVIYLYNSSYTYSDIVQQK